MNVVYSKNLSLEENNLINEISQKCGICFDTAHLLYLRDIDTVEKALTFLHPNKNNFINPFLLNGIKEAVDRIYKAKINNENVLIFGDYDADGICATTVLYKALKEFGVNPFKCVPEREEGYGLNVDKISKINNDNKINLIITVDCGISDNEKIDTLKKMGIDVIVTDHHEPPIDLPDCISINPKIPNQEYGYKCLCGTGVAYKLAYALIGERANLLLDYVAVATIADSMDLIGENRDLVFEGLKLLNDVSIRPEFKFLIADNNKPITSQYITYYLAPRINAAGRLGDANCALSLFTAENDNDKFNIATKLNAYNIQRQVECDKIYKEAKEKIYSENLYKDDVILISDIKWQIGFIGAVASRLSEEFKIPVIVFAEQDGKLKGSARSTENINIYDAINSCKDILFAFGGHSQAAGVTVEKDKFSLLKEKLNSFIREIYKTGKTDKTVNVEWKIEGTFPINFAKEIELLEPFGLGNKRPLFSIDVLDVKDSPIKQNSPHFSFKTDCLEILDFNGEKNVKILSLPIKKTVIFETNLSNYRGVFSVKGILRDIFVDFTNLENLNTYIFENELKKIPFNNYKCLKVATKNDLIKNDLAIMYVVSNFKNLEIYKELNDLEISIFDCSKMNKSFIAVSPDNVPKNCDKIVYLDKPIFFLDSDVESVCFKDICGYNFLENVSLDREVFAEVFGFLCDNTGKEFISSASFFDKNVEEMDAYQFIFSTEVFFELGFFSVNNGILFRNKNVKAPLTDSKIYNRILEIRG